MIYDLDTRKGRYTSYVLYLLNILFLSSYIIGTYNFSQPYQIYIITVEFCLALVFVFEYLSRLDYADNTWVEATNFYSIADLLAILPALLIVSLPIVGQLVFLRSIQVLRVLRFVRIGLEDNTFFNYELTSRQVITAELLILVFIIMNLHAGAIWGFESGINEDINNYGDALYYSVVALTTTGFGNIVPITAAGKMATSIGLIAAVTLIPWLVVRARETGETDIQCSRCGNSKHYSDSNYCWRCGEEIEDTQAERTTQ